MLESIRQYLIHELHFIEIMIYLFEDYSSLTDRVMTCLGGLFSNDPNSVIPEGSFQALSILLWRGMRLPFLNKKPFVFYSRLVLTYCSRYITRQYYNTSLANEMINNTSFVEIDLLSRSRYCLINYENCLEVRNDSWTFETVRSTHAVPPLPEESEASLNEDESHKYAYEVILESNGLMQVGWVTDDFDFDPEGGKGVGDDAQSYGYDGNRAKKWHGRYTNMRTSYGLVWKEGDVVTCAIDLDAGEIRYYKNGKDMGVAFYGVAVKLAWYPVS
jgi:hypothetical protein